jgi:hypothetical protein
MQLSSEIRWKMTPLKFSSCLGHWSKSVSNFSYMINIYAVPLYMLERCPTYEAQVHDAKNFHSFNTILQHNLQQFNQFSQLYRACLILSSLFIYPTNAQLDCSKRMLKFTLIFTLKVLVHVSALQSKPSSGSSKS